MAIDKHCRYVFVGTKTGLIQAYNLSDFSVASEVMTFSTFGVNNIELICQKQELYLVVALSSG